MLAVVRQPNGAVHIAQIVGSIVALVRHLGHVGVLKGAVGHQYGTEELLLECHPLHRGLHVLIAITATTHFVHIVLGGLEVYARVELLGVLVSIAATTAAGIHLLLAVHLVVPLKVHIVRGTHHILQPVEVDVKVHIIFVSDNNIEELDILVLTQSVAVAHAGTETQVYSLVGGNLIAAVGSYRPQFTITHFAIGRKHQVLSINNSRILCREDEVHIVIRRCDKLQWQAVVCVVFAKNHLTHLRTHISEIDRHQLILDGHIYRVANGTGIEHPHVAALVSLQLALGTGVALHGKAVEVRFHCRHTVGIRHTIHIRLPDGVVHLLPLGNFFFARGNPPHVANKDGKN